MHQALSFIIWNINPDMFAIPLINHPIRWYGLSWALGFIISQQVMYFIFAKEGRKKDEVDSLTIYMLIAAVVGARLGHILFYDPIEFLSDPVRIFAIWEGGLASHGGGIGVLLGLFLFSKRNKINYLWLVDRIAIVAALTGCFIRLGNLMNSEVIGQPTDLPWAFVFTRVDQIPRHPAQLYEAIYCLILFVLLISLWQRSWPTLKNGFLAGLFLVVLFTLRFVDEFFKMNQVSFEDDLILNMGQLLSIPFVILGIILLVIKKTNGSQIPTDDQISTEG